MDKFQEAIDKVNKAFSKNQSSYSAEIIDTNSKLVQIDIEGGDWKHDHGFADYTMSINGFKKVTEQTTSEDGSDWYGAIHYYIFK